MRFIKNTFLLPLLILLALSAYAQEFPPSPNPPRLVNDYTGTLTPDEWQTLESKLTAYNDSTSTQISIVILSTTYDYPISQYAFQLGEKWGIGRKEKNNGALILVAKDDREVFIATGYGLEGAIPDALAKRIVEMQLVPAFKQGQFYRGLNEATDTMMKLAAGEYTADDLKPPFPYELVIIIGVFILITLTGIYASYRQAKRFAMTNGIDLHTAWRMINAARRVQSGSWGSFSSGRDSFGGSSSRGFGGFGGGSFGGGGAGGRW